jgi:hypothetical protein
VTGKGSNYYKIIRIDVFLDRMYRVLSVVLMAVAMRSITEPDVSAQSRISAEPEGSTAFMLGLLFDPEDGDDIFRLNFKLSPNYTAL